MADDTSSLLPHEKPLPPRIDLWTAAVFLLLGIAIFSLAWRMPTFKEQKGEIYTAPGLVPGLYGLIICILSIWLAVRSIRRGALAAAAPAPARRRREGTSNLRLALAAALGLVFCVGLIGRMPFWLAAAIFVTAFIVLFEWRAGEAWPERARHIATALVQGVDHRHRRGAGVREGLLRPPALTGSLAMVDSLAQFGGGLFGFMSPGMLFTVLWATFLGIVIGALPGLTATMGVALMTTLTFTMPHTQAILVLVCIYVGAIYGGSRSAILLNIPGTPASACSTLDGYPLARQGLAGRAMGISTTGSWLGTLFGTLCVAALTPVLSEMALKFQSFEFFWIALFGIVIAGTLAGGDPLKGYLAGFLGLWIATIGQEPYYNYQRFAFGSTDLAGGIGLLPALVGAFGVAEVLQAMRGPAVKAVSTTIDSVIPRIARRAAALAHHPALGRHRHLHRHPAGARRGHGRVVVLRRRAPRQQGEGEVRQGLDRGPDGGRDRRERLRARAPSSRC